MSYKLTVQRRESRPRSIVTRLRREGRIPGVVYGKGIDNELVHLDGPEFLRLLQSEGATSVINLTFPDGKTHPVMIREVQQDRIKDRIVHVDFQEVNMNEPVDTEAAIELEGEPKGVKEGGILQQQIRTVPIRCLPNRIPDQLTVDVSGLEIGESVEAGQLNFPEGVELLTEEGEVVASVLPPQTGQEKEADELAENASEAAKAEQEGAE
ncbi:50S ribosomal protein L25/general stress protein Ctc [Paludifilum halophilum]|uniref:Large ribosomal subunit protein bL25 n=1 Tax=Paludifilum halophilum TaxID=1642702 RepID=A0A235B388_9BACL|nr:50S ribosomal protein L25/general stress protein Ctc [Paludifilum halophilum]OYD06367.1 hypothetical protein CHM34_16795 [Paludifilum halophilum]